MCDPPKLTSSEQQAVLQVAARAIYTRISLGQNLQVSPVEYSAGLRRNTATFVTLRLDRNLRGCCGSVLPREPLIVNVARSATAAAFHDPRFQPLTEPELDRVELHMSLLSHPVDMEYSCEEDLLAKLHPGVDGLILQYQTLHAVFLPTVWEIIPTPRRFLGQLKMKAGLSSDFWSHALQVQRFTVKCVQGKVADYRLETESQTDPDSLSPALQSVHRET